MMNLIRSSLGPSARSGGVRARVRRARPVLESLELRRVLSPNVYISAGDLHIDGGADVGNDSVTVNALGPDPSNPWLT